MMAMRRWLFGLLLLLLPWMALAEEVPVPPLSARVTDLTGTLQPEQKTAMEARLAAFEQKKGSQIAVLLVPTTQPEAIEQYGIRVAEAWKLGRKGIDDGILVLMATNDRAVRIEVGYGLEGVVPDVTAKRVIEEIMIPYFRTGDVAGGLNAGVERLIGLVDGEPLPPKQQTASGGSFDKLFPIVFIAAIVIGGLLRAIFGKVLGGVATGGIVGVLVWLLGAGIFFALALAVMAFIFTLGGGRGFHGGGLGGMGGGGFGGGGFGGGGGGFGGGGASGRW